MNADDPKFTAHVLGEFEDLTPAEQAEIEALIANDPGAAAAADETRALVARLRAELPGEAAATLDAGQRAAVLKAATPVGKLVRFPRRAAVLAALAACVIVGVSYALLFRAYESEHAARPAVAESESLVTPVVAVETPVTVEPPPNQPFTLSAAAPEKLSVDEKLEKALADAPQVAAARPAPAMPALQPLVPAPPVARQIVRPATATPSAPVGGVIEFASARGTSVAQSELVPSVDQHVEKGVPSMESFAKLKSYEPSAGIPSVQTAAVNRVLAKKTYFRDRGEMTPEDAAYGGGADTSTFDAITENAFFTVRENPLSTFSTDVDTASYAIVRRYLNDNQLPPKGAVRVEELLNYFTYDYPQPKGDAPFSATMEVATCPWSPEHRLVRVGLKGREIPKDQRPPSNLVFLIDVSGSMNMPNKLPLIQKCFSLLVDQLGSKDRVSIVTYASGTTLQLEPTQDKEAMQAAIARLRAGGCTYGSSGIEMAYKMAEKSFIPGGTNRVILATDGDWNVGVTDERELMQMITRKAKSGVFLTVLGCGMDNLKDSMLVKLADHGNGHYAYIDTELEARKVFDQQLSGTLVTIAKDVKIQVEFNPAQVSSYRLIGYEKRLLAKEDFNDDKKDAGEIGAGHTVTALYEVVPMGKEQTEIAMVDKLKYQPVPTASPVQRPAQEEPEAAPAPTQAEPQPRPVRGAMPVSNEMLTLKLRYKEPDGEKSKLLEFPLTDRGTSWEKSSPDFRFAAAVASYGMLLRGSNFMSDATWSSTAKWAREGLGVDENGYRAEFLGLLEKARALKQ